MSRRMRAVSGADGTPTDYVVKEGDNLTKIAKQLGTTPEALYAANEGVIGGDKNLIKPGQTLAVPGGEATDLFDNLPEVAINEITKNGNGYRLSGDINAGTYRIGNIINSGNQQLSVKTVSENGMGFIKSFEAAGGPALEVYPDKAGKLTIGYGHKLTADEIESGKFSNRKITAGDADALFRQDLARVEKDISRLVKAPLSQQQFDATASLVFNIGASRFSEYNARKQLNQGNYEAGIREFADINKYKDPDTGNLVELQGLTRRRQAEMLLFRTGKYESNR